MSCVVSLRIPLRFYRWILIKKEQWNWHVVSRGTPRLANRFLKRVRDFAQIKYDGKITKEVADFALNLLEVDRLGLDRDRPQDHYNDDRKLWRWSGWYRIACCCDR